MPCVGPLQLQEFAKHRTSCGFISEEEFYEKNRAKMPWAAGAAELSTGEKPESVHRESEGECQQDRPLGDTHTHTHTHARTHTRAVGCGGLLL